MLQILLRSNKVYLWHEERHKIGQFPAAENKKSVEMFCSSVIVSNAIEGFAPTVKPAPTSKSLENVNKKTKDNTVIFFVKVECVILFSL